MLGSFICGDGKRDAIHIAICPAIAEEVLKPADHVQIEVRHGAVYAKKCKINKGSGIVDPYLYRDVHKNEMFYICLYPNTVRSLRHEWLAPEFECKEKSRLYIERIARDIKWTYDQVMEAADRWVYQEEHSYENNERYKDISIDWDEFWIHYEVLTGKRPENCESFFTCSC